MLHSGSRNIGKELADRHISTAKSLHRLNELPSPDLAYFIKGTDEFRNYWNDLEWAQGYAMKNREVMMNRLLKVFNKMFNKGKAFRPEITVNCHHNYVAEETHYGENVFVTRKGAINAEAGRLRNYSRLDGREIVHHQRSRKCRKFQLLLTRRGAQNVAHQSEKAVHPRGFGTPNQRCRMPQRQRRN